MQEIQQMQGIQQLQELSCRKSTGSAKTQLLVQHLKYVNDVPGFPLLGEADMEDMGSVRHQFVTRQVHVGDALVE